VNFHTVAFISTKFHVMENDIIEDILDTWKSSKKFGNFQNSRILFMAPEPFVLAF
jgi:hypothetical protein